MQNAETETDDLLMTLTADIVAAHVGNNATSIQDVPKLISSVYGALANPRGSAAPVEEKLEPAVSVRASVKRDHLVCLEDGKKMKLLKRHLRTEHGMTPDDYRERWGLPANYPMVAPAYAETRRVLAVKIGLGRDPGQARGRRNKTARAR